MQVQQARPFDRRIYDAEQLMANHPPRLHHANKQLVYEVACPPGCRHAGRIVVSRWAGMALPNTLSPSAWSDLVVPRESVFDYMSLSTDAPAVEWHVNFADPDLFFGYGSGLFAQDEIQVAEHPALAAVREALLAEGIQPLTVENGQPIAVLVAGVQRRCRVQTNANAAEGRANGLYGRCFAAASEQAVRRATQAIEPPTTSNILAIAAPRGTGTYTELQISHILQTAYSGFRVAVIESRELADAQTKVIIHSGYWGCGAFGGHRVLMSVLQVLAARLASIGTLVFHTVNQSGRTDLDQALSLLEKELVLAGSVTPVEEVLRRLAAMRFAWGTGDGN